MAHKRESLAFLSLAGNQIPVRIYREKRQSVRASLGKESVIFRLPLALSPQEEQTQWKRLQDWLQGQLKRQPTLLDRYIPTHYHDGCELQVGQRTYRLSIETSARKTHGARLIDGIIHLQLSDRDTQPEKAVRTLLSRVVAQDFLPEISQRVHALNQQHFQRPINAIRLKYNTSNWGSCSNDGNINLSTRLLFAPAPVIDYVIIHELAHLIELNHSPRFWQLVEKAMPSYRQWEAWLDRHGRSCDF